MDTKKCAGTVTVFACVIALLVGLIGCDEDSSADQSTPPTGQTKTAVETEQPQTSPPTNGPPIIPTPTAIVLAGIGIGCVVWLRRRRRL